MLTASAASSARYASSANTTAIGSYERPDVRLPGGGGAADAAHAARELVLLHGGSDPSRTVAGVRHVTAAPGPSTTVRLVTRWGTLRLGADPELVTAAGETPAHLVELGVRIHPAELEAEATEQERSAAIAVLEAAARRGYVVARAFAESRP